MNEAEGWLVKTLIALFAFFVPFFIVLGVAHKDLGVGAYILATGVGVVVLAAVFGKLTAVVQWVIGR